MFDDIFAGFGYEPELEEAEYRAYILEKEIIEAEEAEMLYNEYLLKSAPVNDSDNLFFELDENSAISF